MIPGEREIGRTSVGKNLNVLNIRYARPHARILGRVAPVRLTSLICSPSSTVGLFRYFSYPMTGKNALYRISPRMRNFSSACPRVPAHLFRTETIAVLRLGMI